MSADPKTFSVQEPAAESERVTQFRDEVAALKLKVGGAESERWLLIAGVLALGIGLLLTVIGGVMVVNTTENVAANQRAFMATGTFLGIALMIGGAALFVRYSMARYLRFWLIRLVHESRVNTDRVVDAIEGRSR